ncbi:hypothetical protein [Pseudoalteromonas aurantia]|nr:hypothetical protein [Pseudoalteromonas aurantia]
MDPDLRRGDDGGGWRLGLIGMGPDLRQGDEFMSGWRIYFRESNGGVLG